MHELDLSTLFPRTGSGAASRGHGCPDEERLVEYVLARLAGKERTRLENHLADCDFCRGQVGFLARVPELGPPPPVPLHLLAAAAGERTRLFVRFRFASLVLLGAAGLLAVVALLPPRQLQPQAERETRAPVVAVAGAPQIVHPREGESVARARFDLWWRESPGALAYSVELVDADGDLVWRGRSGTTRLKLPADVVLELDRSYFVWVVAHLPDGASLRSPAIGFRVRPD